MRAVLFAVLMTLGVCDAAFAQQVWLAFGGGYEPSGAASHDAVPLSEYFEPGLVEARYPRPGAIIADAAGSVMVSPAVALGAGIGVLNQRTAIAFEGRVPHPLFFGQPRRAEGVLARAGRREVAIRAEIAWTRPLLNRLRVMLSGGPLMVHASHEMVTGFAIREQGYPFDSAELRPVIDTASGWGIGITSAATASWATSPRLAVSVTGRFSRATVRLGNVDMDAAGPSVTGAVTVRVR
jgi:hypothetical protein